MKGLSLAFFLRDRLLFIMMALLIIGLSIMMLLLERERYASFIELNTIYYFIVLSLFFLGLWLAIDYLRQRAYFNQLLDAIERSDELQSAEIVQSTVTKEQKLVARLLAEQNRAYLNELGKYRRQQELHNHFVLQWVHHMKTPLSVIDLLAQQTLQQELTEQEDQKQLALSLQEETDRMTRGLEMMLYTARLDKFQIDLSIKQVALHEIARTVINAHKKLCIRHSIFPRIDGELWVETDEKWMAFLFNQFISNAIKYSKSKPGAKKLSFQLEPTSEGGGKLAIKDEGIGIAAHDLPRVFDPFFTGENGRTTGESTGMGLYLAKQVCNRLGHTLSIASILGESTTVNLAFQPRGIHILSKSDDQNES
ncbi:two-component sensor histidine kinase [Paenibacillus sp. FSL H8-0548]|uniref:sensor histidine kinase n=1 Tax=Paenibacillus sp. FSL H8-0548 TaxID=1920422 RepID=UPI00096F4910|nr:sensor histidine kinase [Paenibacillus sp. FSL H8-0548]OMF28091.1 two-component sensor histidine kinase [Paenibacillus sp. FSL H8-0548]